MGITNQISNKTFYRYQKVCFNPLVTAANFRTEEALKKCIEHALLQDKKVLAVGFDCSWSHVRNANQASGELIYQEIPPGMLFYFKILNSIINFNCFIIRLYS